MNNRETTCTGSCCAAFDLPYSPQEMEERFPKVIDGPQVMGMLKYIGERRSAKDPEGALKHYYTCIHWNYETKLCKVYQFRPHMCREFPYGDPCPYEGCNYTRPPKLTVKVGGKCMEVKEIR